MDQNHTNKKTGLHYTALYGEVLISYWLSFYRI